MQHRIDSLLTERVNIALFANPDDPDAGDLRMHEVCARVRGEWALHRLPPAAQAAPIVQWEISHIPTGRLVLIAPNLVTGERALRRLEPITSAHLGDCDAGAFALVATALAGLRAWVSVDGEWFPTLDLIDLMAWTRKGVS